MGRRELTTGRTVAYGLVLLVFGIWPNATLPNFRGLLFLILAVLVIAQESPKLLRYLLVLVVAHVALASLGVMEIKTRTWLTRYTLSLSTGMYLVAGIVILNHLQGKDIRWMTTAIRLCALGLIGHWLLQSAGLDPLFIRTKWGTNSNVAGWQMGSFLQHPNYLAAFLALSLPFFLEGRWRLGLIAVVPALVMQTTTTSIAAAGVGLMVWVYLKGYCRGKRMVWITLALFLGMVLYQFVDPVANQINRLQAWAGLLPDIKFFGAGLGMCLTANNLVNIQSDVLLWVFETGFPGMALAVVFAAVIFLTALSQKGRRIPYAVASVTFLVLCIGTIPCRLPALAFVGIAVFSQLEGETDEETPQTTYNLADAYLRARGWFSSLRSGKAEL